MSSYIYDEFIKNLNQQVREDFFEQYLVQEKNALYTKVFDSRQMLNAQEVIGNTEFHAVIDKVADDKTLPLDRLENGYKTTVYADVYRGGVPVTLSDMEDSAKSERRGLQRLSNTIIAGLSNAVARKLNKDSALFFSQNLAGSWAGGVGANGSYAFADSQRTSPIDSSITFDNKMTGGVTQDTLLTMRANLKTQPTPNSADDKLDVPDEDIVLFYHSSNTLMEKTLSKPDQVAGGDANLVQFLKKNVVTSSLLSTTTEHYMFSKSMNPFKMYWVDSPKVFDFYKTGNTSGYYEVRARYAIAYLLPIGGIGNTGV